MIAGWWADPHIAQTELRDGRGVPFPDWATDIEMAEAIGIKVWELEAMPWIWYQRYEVFLSARGILARKRQKGSDS